MCPQGCQYSKEVESFKCDKAKSFLCFDDGCSISFNVFFFFLRSLQLCECGSWSWGCVELPLRLQGVFANGDVENKMQHLLLVGL